MLIVTQDNILDLFDDIRLLSKTSSIIAYDTEFSGVVCDGNGSTLFDNDGARYDKLKQSCFNYTLFQLGICFSQKNSDCFNVYLKPLVFDVFDTNYVCQESTMTYLFQNNFNFNTLRKGVPYIRLSDKQLLKHILDKIGPKDFCMEYFGRTKISFYNAQLSDKATFIKYLKELPLYEQHVLRLYRQIKNLENENLEIDKNSKLFSEFSAESTIEKDFRKIKALFYKMVTCIPMLIESLFFPPAITNGTGDTLCKKYLIGHNCFIDLVFLYEKFIQPLPSTFPEFCQLFYSLGKSTPNFNPEKACLTPFSSIFVYDDSEIRTFFEQYTCSNYDIKNKRLNIASTRPFLFDTKWIMARLESVFDFEALYRRSLQRNIQGNTHQATKKWMPLEYLPLEDCYEIFCRIYPNLRKIQDLEPLSANTKLLETTLDSGVGGDVKDKPVVDAKGEQHFMPLEPESNENFAHQAGYDALMCRRVFLSLMLTLLRNNPLIYKGAGPMRQMERFKNHNPIETLLDDLCDVFYNRMGRNMAIDLKWPVLGETTFSSSVLTPQDHTSDRMYLGLKKYKMIKPPIILLYAITTPSTNRSEEIDCATQIINRKCISFLEYCTEAGASSFLGHSPSLSDLLYLYKIVISYNKYNDLAVNLDASSGFNANNSIKYDYDNTLNNAINGDSKEDPKAENIEKTACNNAKPSSNLVQMGARLGLKHMMDQSYAWDRMFIASNSMNVFVNLKNELIDRKIAFPTFTDYESFKDHSDVIQEQSGICKIQEITTQRKYVLTVLPNAYIQNSKLHLM